MNTKKNWIFVLQPLQRRFAAHRPTRLSHRSGNPSKSHFFNPESCDACMVTVYVASSLTELSVHDYLQMEGF